jgi:hypothetical protein
MVTTTHVGLCVHADIVRAVAMRGAVIVWTGEVRLAEDGSLRGQVVSLLLSMPQRKWERRVVTAMIGPHAAQLKRITGMPANVTDRIISDAVRLNAPRFFLTNGSPLLTSGVVRREGELWCAAVDAPMVETLAGACHAARIRFRGSVPSAAVAGDIAMPEAIDIRFADAYHAAVAAAHSPFLIDPAAPRRAAQHQTIMRAAVGAALFVTIAGVLAAPGFRARAREREATAQLRAIREQSAAPLAASRERAAAADIVRRVEAFRSARRSAVTLLGSLSQALSDSTAIVSFHMDSTGGILVALTPLGSTVVPELSRAAGVVSAEVAGAVTRETVAGAPMQRVTATFRFVRPPAKRKPLSAVSAR